MGQKTPPGFVKRKGIWHIDKTIRGERICVSSGSSDLEEAQRFLNRILELKRDAQIYGVRPSRSFEEAAIKFVEENQHKRSLRDDITRLKNLMPFIGTIPLDQISMEALKPWLAQRKLDGVAIGTINHGLTVVRRILNLAAGEWRDENNVTWLEQAPKIKLLPNTTKKPPYPLSWSEQDRLFDRLPDHLRDMSLFAVNTGCRDQEICNLEWHWEVRVDTLNTSVFVIPGDLVKNGTDRLVVLNTTAQSVVQRNRGNNPDYVFTYKGKPVTRIMNGAWLRARKAVSLPDVRVHDLKHTFGRRLRAAGVSFETRQDLLGHRSQRITTHYSAAELTSLIEAANKIADDSGRPELVILRRSRSPVSRKSPADTRTLLPNFDVSH